MATNNVDWSPVYTQPMAVNTAMLVATGRTMVVPPPPAPMPAVSTLRGLPYPPPPVGTVIAEFVASDFVDPYGTSAVSLSANMPKLPNRFYAPQGAPFPSGVDTTYYAIFVVPANIAVQGLVVQVGLCTNANVNNVDPSGKPAVFGISIENLVSGSSTVDNNLFSNGNVAVTGVLPTTAGVYYQFNASANGNWAPGNTHILRITRNSGSMKFIDLNTGDLLMINLAVLTA